MSRPSERRDASTAFMMLRWCLVVAALSCATESCKQPWSINWGLDYSTGCRPLLPLCALRGGESELGASFPLKMRTIAEHADTGEQVSASHVSSRVSGNTIWFEEGHFTPDGDQEMELISEHHRPVTNAIVGEGEQAANEDAVKDLLVPDDFELVEHAIAMLDKPGQQVYVRKGSHVWDGLVAVQRRGAHVTGDEQARMLGEWNFDDCEVRSVGCTVFRLLEKANVTIAMCNLGGINNEPGSLATNAVCALHASSAHLLRCVIEDTGDPDNRPARSRKGQPLKNKHGLVDCNAGGVRAFSDASCSLELCRMQNNDISLAVYGGARVSAKRCKINCGDFAVLCARETAQESVIETNECAIKGNLWLDYLRPYLVIEDGHELYYHPNDVWQARLLEKKSGKPALPKALRMQKMPTAAMRYASHSTMSDMEHVELILKEQGIEPQYSPDGVLILPEGAIPHEEIDKHHRREGAQISESLAALVSNHGQQDSNEDPSRHRTPSPPHSGDDSDITPPHTPASPSRRGRPSVSSPASPTTSRILSQSGRLDKSPPQNAALSPPRRGRPPLSPHTTALSAVPRGRGRPPRSLSPPLSLPSPSRRGRPIKAVVQDSTMDSDPSSVLSPSRRGRPRKASTDSLPDGNFSTLTASLPSGPVTPQTIDHASDIHSNYQVAVEVVN